MARLRRALDTAAGEEKPSSSGFTLIELLVTMIVIGVLAAIAIPTYTSMRDRANKTRVIADVSSMTKELRAGQTAAGVETLAELTGSSWSGGACGPIGRDISALQQTDACWTNYLRVFDRLAARTQTSLHEFRKGDPWGRPYSLDENEGEPVGGYCLRMDTITSAGPNGIWQDGTRDDIRVRLPRFKPSADC